MYNKEYAKQYYQDNKDRIKSTAKVYYDKNKSKINAKKLICKRNYRNLIRYNITPDEYKLMYELQSGKCAICGSMTSSNGNNLSVDHDHKTGKVRGLLCQRCNLGIARFNDDKNLLLAAANYLSDDNK